MAKRIQRDDLVKQFDQVVKQEIKNHNDSILATNQMLNSMASDVRRLRIEFAESIARQEEKNKKLSLDYNNLHSKFDKISKEVDIKLHKYQEDLINTQSYCDRSIENLEQEVVQKEEFSAVVDECLMLIKSNDREIRELKDFVRIYLCRLEQDFNKLLEDFKDSIINRPNELWDVKKELESKIEVAVVDAKGILRKLQVYEKGAFVMEKNIENIYTQISRLKDKEGKSS